jgi:hypothetical protein
MMDGLKRDQFVSPEDFGQLLKFRPVWVVCASPNMPKYLLFRDYFDLFATGLTQAEDVYGVGDLREAMFLGYFACPGLSLLGLYFNRYATTIADQVMVVILRAVSEEAFAGVD